MALAMLSYKSTLNCFFQHEDLQTARWFLWATVHGMLVQGDGCLGIRMALACVLHSMASVAIGHLRFSCAANIHILAVLNALSSRALFFSSRFCS